MSLNEFFAAAAAAANGAVYLRPAVVSHQDCFPVPGLPHGCKPPPPPLSMQHPCGTSQKPRTMATVPPLHQVIPQPSLSSYDGNSLAFSSSRTSSFAAALRKLAKQAGDPVTGDKDVLQVSPVSSPALSQGSLTPKRTVPSQPPMFLSTHTGAYPSTSPPVVTIAPSRPHASLSTENRKLQVMDLSNLPQGAGSSASNGHLVEPLSLKLDASKSVPRPGPTEKWDDHALSNKVMPPTSGSSQVRPHATIAPLPRPDDSLTSSRGFQPYRGVDDVRASLPHHITSFDHHHSAYPYSAAFLPHPHLSHPAYRFEESLYLDRYSLLRPPLMTFPPQTSIMAPPSTFYPNSRYDLLAQSLSLSSTSNNILNHDRMKREEEQRHRKKETDFDQNRNREHDREHSRENKDQKEKDHREHKERETKPEKEKREKSLREKEERLTYVEHKKLSNTSQYTSPKKSESPSAKTDPMPHFTVNRSPPLPPPPVTSSVPLNLVVHQNNEQHKRETELWLPWQQQSTSHSNKQNHEEGFVSKNHVGVNHQDNHVQSESTIQNKDFVAGPAPYITEMKIPSTSSEVKCDLEPAKYLYDSKKLDMLHQHITELSNKEHPTNDWKHEKGQKISVSNHRKNSCSEPKKVKDENHPNHVYNNSHLQKQINGMVVKPSPYLDEGMHTRLLETEKCRIEFNGQICNKNLSQSHQVEKLPVPVLKPLHVQTNRSDLSPLHKLFTENHLQVMESPVLVSKLDKEFEALQKSVLKDVDGIPDSEDEGIKLHNFVFLTKGPSLPMDMNPEKIKFLRLLGLTSHLKRKKMELESYLKRRKLLHEDDELHPLDQEEKTKELLHSPVEKFSELYTLSETLRDETSPEKLEFAFTLGLNLNSPSKKEENKRLKKIIEEERMRRETRILKTIKRKTAFSLVPKIGEVPSMISHKSVETSISIEALTNSQKTRHGLEIPNETKCTDFSKKKLSMFSHKRGHNQKNQWKQSTFLSDPLKKPLSITDEPTKFKNFSIMCKSVSTQVEESSICGCTVDNNNSTVNKNFMWPGLEMIIEAYIRHQTEQSFEKEILSDQYCHLRLRQVELKSEADNLNKSLVELMEVKKNLEEEGQQYQRTLSSLKQLLQVSKKL